MSARLDGSLNFLQPRNGSNKRNLCAEQLSQEHGISQGSSQSISTLNSLVDVPGLGGIEVARGCSTGLRQQLSGARRATTKRENRNDFASCLYHRSDSLGRCTSFFTLRYDQSECGQRDITRRSRVCTVSQHVV